MSEGGPALGTGASWALALTNHDKGEPRSRLSQVYCRWRVACSPSATLQKELMEDNGPDLMTDPRSLAKDGLAGAGV